MLRIRGLVKRYDRTRADAFAVRDVALDVGAGEFFTLLGPSGCGKTTTLRCVAGLETPDEGEIRIGESVVFSGAQGRVMPVARRDIAMVFQSYAIWPHMTVAANVRFPLEAIGIRGAAAERRVAEALEMVGLGAFRDRPAPLLSGGQQQRVALARAIVKGASLLLLDEPLSNLDARLREQMRVELRDLQRRVGTTFVYVTHDQEEALALSDRVAVMRDGRVVEMGSPHDLYLRPRTAFAARFVGQADLLACTAARPEGGLLLLHTALGPVLSACFPDAPGPRLSLLVRPEHIEFAEEAASGPNLVAGRIARTVFSGRLVEYVVALDSGASLRVQGTSGRLRAEGDAVRLRLPPERCVVVEGLPEDAE
ncbi:ABC transporter ATP-binding protein [Falsiroseomonas oryzae]|uniref:ABC transporter ATP-binding protein n=1 Tax=Falsiroseomonas oryzae TaxID=2766473 RepID=UPI0022EAF63F|nr:ABC transporter ATP-binding protein [Roseomonas sp. MO-31]